MTARSQRPVWLGEDKRRWDHVRIHLQLIHDKRVSPFDFAVYAALVAHAEIGSGDARPAAETMGDYFDVNERTVRRSLKKLETLAYIEILPRAGKASTYRLLPPPTIEPRTESPGSEMTSAGSESVHPGQKEHPTPDREPDEQEPRDESQEPETYETAPSGASSRHVVINVGSIVEEHLEIPWKVPDIVTDATLIPSIELCDLLAAQLVERGERIDGGRSRRWVLDMEALIRLDEREPAQIVKVLNWLHAGRDDVSSFWRVNVRSPAKLRSKWVRMAEQYERVRTKPVQQKMPITDDARDVVAQHYREHGANGSSALTSQPALNRGA